MDRNSGVGFFSVLRFRENWTSGLFIEFGVCAGLWIAALLALGSPFPFDYDSVNYSLAMVKDYDIRIDQPHAPGYLFHIAFGRLLLPILNNPIRVQQIQNLAYLIITLLCLSASSKRKPGDLLFFASLPLLVFLACVPVIHTASLAAASLLAWSIFKVSKGKLNPIVPMVIYFISVGFRQDLMLFLGPVALWTFLREDLTLRRLLFAMGLGLVITATWYFPTKWLSGNVSPLATTESVFTVFAGPSSFFLEGSGFEAVRKAVRFLLFGIAVLGPAGLILLLRKPLQPLGMEDRIILLLGTLPALLFLVFVFGPRSTYYAPILGFLVTWCFLHYGLPAKRGLIWIGVAVNLAFFWVVPLPNYARGDAGFFQRSATENLRKQASYIGANGRAVIQRQKRLLALADHQLRTCSVFADRDNVTDARIWAYMADRIWRNQFGGPAECIIGRIRPGDPIPNASVDGIGFWHKENGVSR